MKIAINCTNKIGRNQFKYRDIFRANTTSILELPAKENR